MVGPGRELQRDSRSPALRIIHVIRGKADPQTLNGVNRIVHGLATAQAVRGQDVEVWGISRSPGEVRHQHSYPLRMFSSFGFRLRATREIRSEIARLPPQRTIVHFHSVLVREFYAIVRELEDRGIEWVHSPHGGYSTGSLQRRSLLKRLYFSLFEHRLVQGAAAVLATGRSEIEDIKRLVPEAQTVFIANGQERQLRIEPTDPPGDRRPLFGFCGRLAMRHKGLDLLIEGFAQYIRQGGSGTLWLIGDGEDGDQLRAQVRASGLDDRVVFKGPQFGDAKTRMLCQLDYFVHTSRWEGLPMVLLDAAALGIPMLVSKPTNFGEFVTAERTGIVLERNDAEGIAEALLSVDQDLETGRAVEVRDRARVATTARPDWDVVSERIEAELYGYATLPRRQAASRSPAAVLTDLFDFFARKEISYVVVGDTRTIPFSVTSDVDIVFSQQEVRGIAPLLAEFAREHSLALTQVIRHENTAFYCCFVWTAGGGTQTLVVDYCGDFVRQSRLVMPATELLDGRRDVLFGSDQTFSVPRTSAAFVYYLAKRLDKQALDLRSIAYLSELRREDPEGCLKGFLTVWSQEDRDDLEAIFAAARDNASFSAPAERLRNRARSTRKTSVSMILGSMARIVDRLVHPTGISVAMIGPDGSGKSTVLDEVVTSLLPVFRRTRQLHLKPTLGRPRERPVVSDPHGRPNRGGLVSVGKLFYLGLTYFLGYWLQVSFDTVRSTLVTFDRYVYDLVADPRRWRYGGPQALLPLLLHLAPKPDIAIYLDTPAEVAIARKQEVGLDECRRQVVAYRRLAAERPEIHAVAADRNVDLVITEAIELIVHHMALRIRRRMRNWHNG
jgi:glycosyltransferase involved in cell wall biosynthesis/thymidylate kinase